MEKSAQDESGCCRDESRFVKNNTDQVQDDYSLPAIPELSAPAVVYPVSLIDFEVISPSYIVPQTHAPPDLAKHRVYLQICSFLI